MKGLSSLNDQHHLSLRPVSEKDSNNDDSEAHLTVSDFRRLRLRRGFRHFHWASRESSFLRYKVERQVM